MNEIEFKRRWGVAPEWMKGCIQAIARTMYYPGQAHMHSRTMIESRKIVYKHDNEDIREYVVLVRALEDQYILEYVATYSDKQKVFPS